MDSHHQPPGSEPGALLVELQGKTIRQLELHQSLADTSGVRRCQRFGGIFKMVEPRGLAPRSAQCHCVVLLLDDGPEMDAHPGLAPDNSVLQTDGSTTLPCARFLNGVTAGIRTRIFWFTARNSDS